MNSDLDEELVHVLGRVLDFQLLLLVVQAVVALDPVPVEGAELRAIQPRLALVGGYALA
jgi:hypothetical protein